MLAAQATIYFTVKVTGPKVNPKKQGYVYQLHLMINECSYTNPYLSPFIFLSHVQTLLWQFKIQEVFCDTVISCHFSFLFFQVTGPCPADELKRWRLSKSGSVSPPFHKALALSCTLDGGPPPLFFSIATAQKRYPGDMSMLGVFHFLRLIHQTQRSFLDFVSSVQLRPPTSIRLLIHTSKKQVKK